MIVEWATISHVRQVAHQLLRYLLVAVADAFITWFCFRLLHRNPTTVGFVFLLAILVVSATWGLRLAIFMAVLATLLYNFFFLPPLFTFTIADPQNWIALFAFLATAVIGSQLSERARRRTQEANQRQRELERLFALSQQVLLTDNVFELLNKLPAYIAEIFGAAGVALFLENKQKTYFSDINVQPLFPFEQLRAVSGRGEPIFDRNQGFRYMPLRMGVRSVGTLAVNSCDISRETLEAVGSLVATAIERNSTMEKLSKAEAARESDRLRALLLDSVTHEFRTPLTAIKASAQTLLSEVELDKPQLKELATVINEESDRLNRLVEEAAEVAQLDGRQVELYLEPHPISEAVRIALQKLKNILDKHPVEVAVAEDLPDINMDLDRVVEVLVQLLDNAAKYSPPESRIHISAEQHDNSLVTSVADHGPGIDDIEQTIIFEKFYRGKNQRVSVQGTGMGLAIARAIVELHGGTIGLTSQLDRGSVFYFSLPTNVP
jgi:two-component system sensor histidine kinase KdpD